MFSCTSYKCLSCKHDDMLNRDRLLYLPLWQPLLLGKRRPLNPIQMHIPNVLRVNFMLANRSDSKFTIKSLISFKLTFKTRRKKTCLNLALGLTLSSNLYVRYKSSRTELSVNKIKFKAILVILPTFSLR